MHWRRAEARHVARRVRELVDSGAATRGRDRPPLRRRHRRGVVRGGAARGRPADLSRHRPRLLRPAAGRRPALLPTPAPQPLRRRGARHRARVALRRRLERRARADPPRAPAAGRSSPGIERALPAELDERDERLLRAFRQRFDRLVDGVGAALARAALRADRRRSRLRPGRARAVGRPAPLREPAQARPARALVRGAARPRRRGLRPLRRRAGGGRRARARRGRGGGGRRRGAAAHDPRGEGARVQGRRRRRRGPRPGAPPRPTRSSASADGRFGFRVADPATGKRHGAFGYEEVREAARRRTRPSACASTTSR